MMARTLITEHDFSFRRICAALLLWVVKWFEELGAAWPAVGTLYGHLFYESMVQREMVAAGLSPGMKVLHIGSGRLPLTAMAMARRGMRVDAIDNDLRAVQVARRLVEHARLTDRVDVQQSDGTSIDCSRYDAVLLSLHVLPKRAAIFSVLQTLSPGARLIYRNPRGMCRCLYETIQPADLAGGMRYDVTRQTLGKQTVVVQRPAP